MERKKHKKIYPERLYKGNQRAGLGKNFPISQIFLKKINETAYMRKPNRILLKQSKT
jgi:hypothetical protein